MGLINVLSSSNYIIVNKLLGQSLGLNEAILLGEFASEYEYWQQRDGLENGYFFSTIENVYSNTTLSGKQQRTAMNNLKDKGIIDVVIKGMPAKRYIKINEEQVVPYLLGKLCQKGTTSCAIREQQEVPKGNSNKNNINNNKNNIYISEFSQVWELYPRKIGKDVALKAYIKARKSGTTFEEIKKGVEQYTEYVKGQDKQYIKHGSTWFNQKGWQDVYTTEEKHSYAGYDKSAYDELLNAIDRED